MIRILLCCGGGFSSSAMAKHMQDEIIEKHMEEQVSVEYQPFALAYRKLEEKDIIVCCPHLRPEIPTFMKEHDVKIPIYVLPTRMYGLMKITEIFEDAQDALQLYQETGMNPVHFPNEPNPLVLKRYLSYRKTYGDYHDVKEQ